MLKLGIDDQLVLFIKWCITSITYSININGTKRWHFKLTQGNKQVDPLNPFLFLICSKGLSTLLRLAKFERYLKGVRVSKAGPRLFYLLFTYDSIIFGEAFSFCTFELKSILREYDLSSGQYVNFEKSTIFFSPNVLNEAKNHIVQLLGLWVSANFKRYLGLPNLIGHNKCASF